MRCRKVPKYLLEEALALRDSGKHNLAEELLSGLVAKHPSDLDLRIVYAGLLFSLKRHRQSIEHFQAILKTKPRAEAASLGLFHALWKTGHQPEAVEEIRRFLSVGGESMEYRRLLKDIAAKVASDSDEDSSQGQNEEKKPPNN